MYETRQELAKYLQENDPETLDWLVSIRKEFGPAETFAYIKPQKPIKPLSNRETAAKMSDEGIQVLLDLIISSCNHLTKEAKSRYGQRGNLFLCPDGRLLMLRDYIDGKYRTPAKLKMFESGRTCSLAETSIKN